MGMRTWSLRIGWLLALGLAAFGEFVWPTEQTTVRIQGETVPATWRKGRPFVSREKTRHLLHIRSGPDEIDLIQALPTSRYEIRLQPDGSIDCRRRPAQGAAQMQSVQGAPSVPDEPIRGLSFRQQQELIHTIGQELAVHTRRPVRWTFTLVDNPGLVNAWCTGEGQAFVASGLMKLELTRHELAGILGHEIAHGARQHVTNRLLQVTRQRKARAEIADIEKRSQQIQREYQESSPINHWEAREKLEREMNRLRLRNQALKKEIEFLQSYQHFEQSFNHAQEREADAFGMDYCIAAGYAPDGALRAFEKMLAHGVKTFGSRAAEGSKTHPPLPERIKRLRTLLQQRGYAP